jgi:hypothetical protein
VVPLDLAQLDQAQPDQAQPDLAPLDHLTTPLLCLLA